MRKVRSAVMLFVMTLSVISPLVVNAEEITSKEKENINDMNKNGDNLLSAPTDIVDIPDDSLKECLQQKLVLSPTDDITVAQMESLDGMLFCGSSSYQNFEIKNLSGLEYATNLRQLGINNDPGFHGNQISDLSPISNLTKLNMLQLNGNQISDLSPISNLTNLETLWLQDNQINDISPISNFKKLVNLNLSGNQISDLTPLSTYPMLLTLDLSNNKISDFSPLSSSLKSTMSNFRDQTLNIDLGTFVNEADIPEVYKLPIKEGNGTEHEVTIDLSKIVEGKNNFAENYSFIESSISANEYSGVVNLELVYSPSTSNEKPAIEGVSDITLNMNDAFDPMQGVTATDKEDGDLTSELIIIDNNLNTSKVGSYKITYSVTDSDGNKTDDSRNIKVIDKSTSKPEGGGDITPTKPGDKDVVNELMTTGSNLSTLSLLILTTLIVLKKYSIKILNRN